MNAPAKINSPANTAIWDALSKTDPSATKGFSRAGGFKGTAIKPLWIVKRLTEQFGPVGIGWGMDRPEFQVVPVDGEVMVYCTVGCWIAQADQPRGDDPFGFVPRFYGVGGDKVTTKRRDGPFNDDEAFKKAFTDAVGNAFKFLGVGADVHMGMFDDSKYVRAMEREFAAASEGQGQSEDRKVSPAPKRENWGGTYPNKTALHRGLTAHQRDLEGCGDLAMLDALTATKEWREFVATAEEHAPHYLYGGEPAPEEFKGLLVQAKQMRDEFNLKTANHMADLANT